MTYTKYVVVVLLAPAYGYVNTVFTFSEAMLLAIFFLLAATLSDIHDLIKKGK